MYIRVPDEDKTYYTLVTVIIGLLYRELVKLANLTEKKKIPVQMDWILDEFANCPPLPDIESIVSVARSRGMRFHFFVQSFSQLDNVYGKEVSQIILDNAGLIYLKTNTQDSAEQISRRLGKTTIESNSISHSISLKDYNGNQSSSLIAKELMTADEVKQLHYKTIIFPILGYPIFRETVMYDKFSCYVSGEELRETKPIEDLKDTYFTVEQLKPIISDNIIRNPLSRNDKKETLEEDIYTDIQKNFDEAKKVIVVVLDKLDYQIYFKKMNYTLYMEVIIKNRLPHKDKSIIKAKINKSKYHVEITQKEDNAIIEVHDNSLSFIN